MTSSQPKPESRLLILIRHCESTGQEPDAPLSETGHRQAQFLANFLSRYPVDHITASEYLRAQQSIQPFADQNNLPVHVDHRLNERTLSADPIENWQQVIRDSFADPKTRAPGGESASEVLERSRSALNDILTQDRSLPVLVTHGNLLAILLHSIDQSFGFQGWQSLTNPDAYLLQQTDHGRFAFERIWHP